MPRVNAFITGGSGFVGRNLVSYLRFTEGFNVTVLSRSENSDEVINSDAKTLPTLSDVKYREEDTTLTLLRGDLSMKEDQFVQNLTGIDVVFHLAAKVDLYGPWEEFQESTVDATERLVRAAKKARVSAFIHCSTEAVFVQSEPGHMGNLTEESERNPPNWARYSLSKYQAEEAVFKAAQEARDGFKAVVVRPRLIWGRGDTKVLDGFYTLMKEGNWRWCTPSTRTSTVHVVNVCEGLVAAFRYGKNSEAYFVTDGEAVDFKEFVSQYVTSAYPTVSIPESTISFKLLWSLLCFVENIPFFGIGVERKGFQDINRQALALMGQDVVVSDAKARKELHYKGLVSKEKGMADIVNA